MNFRINYKTTIGLVILIMLSMHFVYVGSVHANDDPEAKKMQSSQELKRATNRSQNKTLLSKTANQNKKVNKQKLKDNEWPLCIPTIGHTCPP